MINIENKLFHGININNYIEIINNLEATQILESILKLRKILTREELEQENKELLNYINPWYSQKVNEVSLAFHIYNKRYRLIDNDYQDAFYDYILPNISIVLDDRILIDRNYSVVGLPREIRLTDSILLDGNIEGIGYRDKLNKLIIKINKLIDSRNYIELKKIIINPNYYYFFKEEEIKKFVNDEYTEYNKIKELLEIYNYDIAIVDPVTGQEHNSVEDSCIETEKILSKIKNIREKL